MNMEKLDSNSQHLLLARTIFFRYNKYKHDLISGIDERSQDVQIYFGDQTGWLGG